MASATLQLVRDELFGMIVTGGTFASFEQFDSVFTEWKRTKFHPFRVASSETLRDASHQPNSVFKYRCVEPRWNWQRRVEWRLP